MSSKNNDPFHVSFNQQRYFFKVTFYNGVDDPVEFELKHIDELVIEENIFQWYSTGSLILNTNHEIIERGIPIAAENLPKIPELYTFRNDGKNKINIQVRPLHINESDEETGQAIEPVEDWNINYDFVVYDVQELYSKDISDKKKKLLLWDERYQYFLERNIQWCTYYLASKNLKTNKLLVDKDNRCIIGDALKHLIRTACGETEYNNVADILKVGWVGENGDITSPKQPVATFSKNLWDNGAEENKITYTSPTNFSVVEDIDYLMQHYIATKNTVDEKKLGLFGFLRFHRYKKEWELIGIRDLYEKSKTHPDNYIETLYIETTEMPEDMLDGASRTPAQGYDGGYSSTITSYRFVNMSPSDDMSIANRLAVQYENTAGIWKIFLKDSSMNKNYDFLKKELLPLLYKSDSLLINIKPDKNNGLITIPEHILYQNFTARVFWRNYLAYQNIFLNHAIEFDCRGLTIRTPGKFIGIDRTKNISPGNNKFEDKLIGQWLLSKVTHMFKGSNYTTNCIGVKVNSHKQINSFVPGV